VTQPVHTSSPTATSGWTWCGSARPA